MPVLPRAVRDIRREDALLLLGAACWGSTYLVAKELLPHPDRAPVLVATRMLLSAAALALFALLRRRDPATAAEWRTGILLGLPLSAVFALETYGIALTSATNAGVLIALCIVLVPFAEAAVRRTRLRPAVIALCGAAMAGSWLIASGDGLTPPGPGDLLILGAALARVVHVTSSSALQARRTLDPHRLTAIQLGTVGVVFAALCPLLGAPVGAFFTTMTLSQLLALLYLAIVAGAVVFAIQTWGIAATSATHAGLLLGTEPVWAALFGVALAGDRLSPAGAVGIVLVLVAVLWAQRLSARGHDEGRRGRVRPSAPGSADQGTPSRTTAAPDRRGRSAARPSEGVASAPTRRSRALPAPRR